MLVLIMNSEELKLRTKKFAHRCVKVAMALPKNTLGNYLSSQLIRCACSTAANYRAACIAQSKATFAAKISIAFEECDESLFWLEFIEEEKLINKEKLGLLMTEASELSKILGASRKTSQKNK
ncbi:MAG: four helix bundle protein [Bacteroidota bacterium]